MTTATLAGQEIQFDKDGFMLNPDQWTPEVAVEIARSYGVALTEKHWRVIDFARSDFAIKNDSPGVRRICKELNVPTKEMYALFPKGPGILAARIAGVPKPKSCV